MTENKIAVWKCQDSRRLRVIDMSTDHIQKALAMRRSKGFIDPSEFGMGGPPQGEHARDVWEDRLLAVRFSRFISIFERELGRRKSE